MASKWLLEWDTELQSPTVEICESDEMLSFAQFPEIKQSFVLFDGFLFDRHNFKADLVATDAERVIEYYNIYGEDLFSKLRGAYSLIIWDSDKQCLIVGRDHMGQVPFYYYWNDKKLLVSSSMRVLLAHPDITTDLNRIIIAEHLLFFWSDHQLTETYFENIFRLPPAHYFKVLNQHLSFSRYWNPIPPGFGWASEVEENNFPELFEQAVSRCLSVGADSIFLSGGYDSPSVAVMAERITKRNRRPSIHAISAKEATFGAKDGELQYAIAQALNMPQALLSTDEILPEGTIIQASLKMSDISPIPNINPFESTVIRLMAIAGKSGRHKVMSGEGGDELFNINRVWPDDLYASGQILKAFRVNRMLDQYYNYSHRERVGLYYRRLGHQIKKAIQRSWAGTNIPLINNLTRIQPYKIPSWISNDDKIFLETLEYRLNYSRNHGLDEFESNYIQSRRSMLQDSLDIQFLEQKYYHARNIGFTNFYPYYDLDLMALVYRIKPESLVRDYKIKAPLQLFLKRNLPEIDFPNKKADFNPVIHRVLRSQGKLAWRNLGRGNKLGNLGIIATNNLNEIMQQYFTNQSQSWTTTWMAMSIESWLNSWQS